METLQWNDRFSISIQEIDEQHKMIFALINELSAAIANCQEGKGVSDALMKMVDYLNSHFAAEEGLMVKFNYPDYDLQRSQHADFILQTMGFAKRLMAGDKGLSNDLLEYLHEWVTTHILVSDRKLGLFLTENWQL